MALRVEHRWLRRGAAGGLLAIAVDHRGVVYFSSSPATSTRPPCEDADARARPRPSWWRARFDMRAPARALFAILAGPRRRPVCLICSRARHARRHAPGLQPLEPRLRALPARARCQAVGKIHLFGCGHEQTEAAEYVRILSAGPDPGGGLRPPACSYVRPAVGMWKSFRQLLGDPGATSFLVARRRSPAQFVGFILGRSPPTKQRSSPSA